LTPQISQDLARGLSTRIADDRLLIEPLNPIRFDDQLLGLAASLRYYVTTDSDYLLPNSTGDTMLEKIGSAPVLTLLVGVAGILTAVTGVTSGLGLPSFWSDAFTCSLFASLTIYWAVLARRAIKSRAAFISLSISDVRTQQSRIKEFFGFSLVSLMFCGLTLWTGYNPVKLINTPKWRLCGTFVSSCGPRYCMRLFDSKQRALSGQCARSNDESGWLMLERPNWWTYKPESIVLECSGNKTIEVVLPPSAFENECRAIVRE
jgi:hypothetical protein